VAINGTAPGVAMIASLSSIWDKRLETHHAEIDLQHRTLFDALFRLRSALEEGHAGQELRRTFDFLKAYSAIHFRLEEDLMALHGYSREANHRAWHQRFTAQVQALAEDSVGDPETKGSELVHFLETWLQEHILEEDRRMVAEIQGQPFRE